MVKQTTVVAMALVFFVFTSLSVAHARYDYRLALTNSIVFYEAQRSGRLPADQRVTWRADSGLMDGIVSGVDLVGGYYDAGDNVKFGFPLSFTITLLSWSIIEYKNQLEDAGQLDYAMDAVKWGTDYLLKAHLKPYLLYAQVGDGDSDHICWQRPENMTTSRKAYAIDNHHPGSDLAAETSAAMAASSLVFHDRNFSYSQRLLKHAEELFRFANEHRGLYSDSIPNVQKFYNSSGDGDELLWAAAWLYFATGEASHLNYLASNGDALGAISWSGLSLYWNVKYAGVYALSTKILSTKKGGNGVEELERYQKKLENLLCSFLGKSTIANVKKTPGGLLFFSKWNNMHPVVTAAFLAVLYSDLLPHNQTGFQCGRTTVSKTDLTEFAKSQVDYILGDNPRGMSYMVGFGDVYPLNVHHRGASTGNCRRGSSCRLGCRDGFSRWYRSPRKNPHVLLGALVGGPNSKDKYKDKRSNYVQTEPTIYNNAALVGLLARIHDLQKSVPA